MEQLQLKRVIFTPTEIVLLRRRGKLTIRLEDISKIRYTRMTFWRLIESLVFWNHYPEGPGEMTIYLNKKILNKDFYNVTIRYKDVLLIPEPFNSLIDGNW